MVESGSKRYVLYALGEVLLVMIGILLALQVNNWNEARKNRVKEKFYLNGLITELMGNKQVAEDQKQYQEFQQRNAEMVLDAYMKNRYPEDFRDLAIAIEHTAWLYPTQYQKNVWNELNSTGNLSLIRNDSLRQNLSKLYSRLDYVDNLREEFNEFLYEYRKATTSVLNPYLRKEINVKLDPIRLKRELDPISDIEETIDRLLKIENLDGQISNVIMKNVPMVILFSGTSSQLDRAISDVNRELTSGQ